MQPVTQWSTRSSGRTQVRSAQVEGGREGGEFLRVLGSGVGKEFLFQKQGKVGLGGADFEALFSLLLGFLLQW